MFTPFSVIEQSFDTVFLRGRPLSPRFNHVGLLIFVHRAVANNNAGIVVPVAKLHLIT